ncbi:MAG: Crp/Fnr family transcriptional regulator [Dehalococcoidia bacterium]|nr:MAG: Crp/Fnr family transcriptional regulator [Dehalococcoidia bacterium]
MVSKLELLKSSPYFLGLGSDELEAIGKLVFEKSYNHGAIILLEGETAEALYFVASGVVKVFKTSTDGKEQTLAIIRPQETFNEVPVLDGDVNPASVQAMTAVTLYGIRSRDMENILHVYPLVAINVIKIMAGRLRHLVALVEDLSFRHVIGRVAKILLEYATDGTSSGPKLTQRDMAAMAGTAREVVSRSLKNLEKDGLVKIDRQRIIIKDREALSNIVSPLFETKVTDR